MSTETSHSPLKNGQEKRKIKEEITLLESQLASALATLEEAQRLVAGLTKTLEERKWSIAPIRLLPSEILSSIIELCALDDWTSPLRIGCVSHHLRNAALNTPRSWCSVLVDDREGMAELYFERSGQYKLHVGLLVNIALPPEAMHRIKCMTARSLSRNDFASFSSLEWLCVHDVIPDLAFSEITSTLLPLLRHLDISKVIKQGDVSVLALPRLESLGLRVQQWADIWITIIRHCSASLTSLYLYFTAYHFIDTPTQIDLPALQYFKMEYLVVDDQRSLGWLSLNAPALRVYIDPCNSSELRCVLKNGWGAITHVRIEEVTLVRQLKAVRALQLKIPYIEIRDLLEELMTGNVLLPHLESLEFYAAYGTSEDAILAWQSHHYPGLRASLVSEPWAKGPHWDSGPLCDIHMPCNPDGIRFQNIR